MQSKDGTRFAATASNNIEVLSKYLMLILRKLSAQTGKFVIHFRRMSIII